jgi:hypothetical protein
MSEASFAALRETCVEALPWPAIYGSGEFHLSKSFLDVDFECLQLAGPIVRRGPVRVIVGDYVGSDACVVAALKKSKGRPPPPAACGLMSAHSSTSMTASPGFNFLEGLTSSDVDAVLAAGGIRRATDQAKLINVIGGSRTVFFQLKAAPGSSKTTLAEGIVRASLLKLKEDQKIIWLLKTRQQRDKQLDRFRSARGALVEVAVLVVQQTITKTTWRTLCFLIQLCNKQRTSISWPSMRRCGNWRQVCPRAQDRQT